MSQNIIIQREQIQKGNPKIELSKPCRIGDGILSLSKDELDQKSSDFESLKGHKTISFFIPASGSGSRMFGFLYEYMQSSNPSSEAIKFTESFIQNLKDFAFYSQLPERYQKQLEEGDVDIKGLIEFILTTNGLDYGGLPKGLVPFHFHDEKWHTPFQEHLIQGTQIAGEDATFHFTINRLFEDKITDCIETYEQQSNRNFNITYSEQNPESNSYAFGKNLTPVKDENGKVITRPAGHGALLQNLNSIDSDFIFIRNIDNIQHPSRADKSLLYHKALGGVLIEFQNSIHDLLRQLDQGMDVSEEMARLNEKYGLQISNEILTKPELLHTYLNRPLRICGMVKNEGQPGGGPFWVSDEKGHISRQIVEKAQISQKGDQLDILVMATHFNPVELICAVKDYEGNKFELNQFKNQDLYFIVNKTHEGKPIRYIEKPGLWNGAMAEWITLFYEIDTQCFSPVKTVLDLLNDSHNPQ